MMKHRLLFFLLFVFHHGNAQISSLHSLLQTAEENYPSIKSKRFSIESAKSAVEVSNRSNMPSLDAGYQINYATHNNISGMASSQFFVPISGPPSSSNNYSPAFGTVTGLLFNWQPISFGQHESQVAYSQEAVNYAKADAANEILQHKVKLSSAYLDVLTMTEIEKLYLENVNRTKTNLATAKTLVANGIKPGSDTALFAAELSKATIELLTIRKSKEQTIILLQQLSASNAAININDSSFFNKLPSNGIIADTTVHPLISLYQATIELDKAKRKTISKTTAPILGVWGTGYARGSDVQYDGSVKSFDGLGLQRVNYGMGVQLSMPLLQSSRIKPQLKQQDLQVSADEEKKNELALQLNGQTRTAESTLALSMDIAKEGKGLVNSANFAYNALLSRYSAGLANYTDLIQAQYNLVKAKTDFKTNYMAVWKSLLYKAAVTGNLNLFLQQVN